MPEGPGNITDLKSIPSLIPEVYYDLISRVPAGCILLAGLAGLVLDRNRNGFLDGVSKLNGSAVIAGSLLYIMAGYAAGLLLSSCGALLTDWYWPRLFRNVASHYNDTLQLAIKLFQVGDPQAKNICSSLKDWECRSIYRQTHDYLKRNDMEAKLVIPKIQAEAALAANLACTVLLEFFAYLLLNHTWPGITASVIAVTVFALSWWCAIYRTRRLLERQFSYFALSLRTDQDSKDKALAAGAS